MKRFLLALLIPASLAAQTPDTAVAAYINPGTGWAAWSAALGSGSVGSPPPAVALYCQASAGAAWQPCNPTSGAGFTLTTTGTSGAATLTGTVLNIPQYSSALSAYLPLAGGTMSGTIVNSSISGGTVVSLTKLGVGGTAALGYPFEIDSSGAAQFALDSNGNPWVVGVAGGSCSGNTFNMQEYNSGAYGLVIIGSGGSAGWAGLGTLNSPCAPAAPVELGGNTQVDGTITGTSSATLGANGATGGSLVLNGSTSGSATINTSATGVLALPSGTTLGGSPIQTASQGTISTGPAIFGSSAVNTVVATTIAGQAGHFTNLAITSVLGGTCTTAPTFNVFDGTTNVGTAKIATSTTQTKGTTTNQTQTLTFAAGDIIGVYISIAGSVCTTDTWVVSAQYSTP